LKEAASPTKVASTGQGCVAVDIAEVRIEARQNYRKGIVRAWHFRLGENPGSQQMVQQVAQVGDGIAKATGPPQAVQECLDQILPDLGLGDHTGNLKEVAEMA
jgi:hypothetical protein